jgi:hypothetical protein
MANVPVPQFITAMEIRQRTAELDCPYGTVAFFAGINASTFSLVLSRKRALSWEAQYAVSTVLNFLEEVAQRAAPWRVDFSQIGALSGAFLEYQKKHLESEVVKTNKELHQGAEAK